MPQNRWTGLLAHIGRPTAEGDTLELLHVDEEPLPLLHAEPGADYYDTRIGGSIQKVTAHHDGTVRGEGFTDLEPGTYAVGVDLARVHAGRAGLRGILVAATVHSDDTGRAWPDAQIVVTAP